GLILAIDPFATVPFELAVDRRGLLRGGWRLAPGGDTPRGFVEHVQAWVLRHLLLSIVLVVLLVTALFVTLLCFGPPVSVTDFLFCGTLLSSVIVVRGSARL